MATPSFNDSGAGEAFTNDVLGPQQEVGANCTSILVTGLSGRNNDISCCRDRIRCVGIRDAADNNHAAVD